MREHLIIRIIYIYLFYLRGVASLSSFSYLRTRTRVRTFLSSRLFQLDSKRYFFLLSTLVHIRFVRFERTTDTESLDYR